MNKQPTNAAELVRKGHIGLSRYKTIPVALTKLSGWLEDVETTGENDAWIVVRPVDGLPGHNMATATIRNPAPEVDQLLERIGRNGQITLIGIASTKTDGHRPPAHERGPLDQRHAGGRDATVAQCENGRSSGRRTCSAAPAGPARVCAGHASGWTASWT